MLFEDYRDLCKVYLVEDKPEELDNVFMTLNTQDENFRPYFIKHFTGWVMNYYFLPVLDRQMQFVIFPEWQELNSDWRQKLEQALLAKKTGSIARAMRQSLSSFAKSR